MKNNEQLRSEILLKHFLRYRVLKGNFRLIEDEDFKSEDGASGFRLTLEARTPKTNNYTPIMITDNIGSDLAKQKSGAFQNILCNLVDFGLDKLSEMVGHEATFPITISKPNEVVEAS